ncbi:MAG: hypothetical protein ACE5FU_07420, partial [Nitrospinota bacterium]
MENDFLGKPLEFCPKCGDEQDEREKQQKIRAEQETINRKITNAMLSPRFKTKTFENYVIENSAQTAAVRDIKKFIENFDTSVGLIFIGNSGTGKNHLASAVVKEIVLKHNKTALVTK